MGEENEEASLEGAGGGGREGGVRRGGGRRNSEGGGVRAWVGGGENSVKNDRMKIEDFNTTRANNQQHPTTPNTQQQF